MVYIAAKNQESSSWAELMSKIDRMNDFALYIAKKTLEKNAIS